MRSKFTVLTAADHADHLVALVEQELGEVGAVLAGDAGDERALGHGSGSTLTGPQSSANWVGTWPCETV